MTNSPEKKLTVTPPDDLVVIRSDEPETKQEKPKKLEVPEEPAPAKKPEEKKKAPDKKKQKKQAPEDEQIDFFANSKDAFVVEERKQIKYDPEKKSPEKKEDIRSIKDSLARIKNKRKGM